MATAFLAAGMKRGIYLGAALAALFALGVLWFVNTYERVETKIWVGPSGAARNHPYLAATRFVQKLGVHATELDRGEDFNRLVAAATLFMPSARPVLTPDHLAMLRLWIRNGGHLIVEPEPLKQRDPVLDALAVGRGPAAAIKPTATLAIELPGAGPAVRVAAPPALILELTRVRPEFVAATEAGAWFATWREGQGRITILTGMRRLQNAQIGLHDHAEFLRQLLALTPAKQQFVLLRSPQELPLWGWLAQHGVGTLTAGLLLIALTLWRAGLRFGPIRPDPQPQRRQLLEHLRACGRFRWASGARAALVDHAREVCLRRVHLHQPSLVHVQGAQRALALAATTGIGAEPIAQAFDSAPQSTREFVQIVATLASIHDALAHAGRRRVTGRKRR